MAEYGNEGPRGVGGWLAFFLVVIGIFSPIRVVIELVGLHTDTETATTFGDRWSAILGYSWVLSIVMLAICWFVTWRLLTVHNWQSVRITIAGIWAVSVGAIVLSFVLVSIVAQFSLGAMFAGGALDLVRAVIFALIWTAYFRLSKRVANTYRDRTGEEAAEVFS